MLSKKDKKLQLWNDLAALDRLKRSLAMGHISITSTDTILGFLANISEKAFQELNKLKGGRVDKPYVILIAPDKLEKLLQIESLDARVQALLKACWPGPVTMVFKARPELPSFLVSPQGTIAVRVPAHQGLLSLLASYDGLFSTSANKSGEPAPMRIEEVADDILEKIEYIVIDQDAPSDASAPSTILDLSGIGQGASIRVLREGAYSIAKLEGLYGSPFQK